MTRTVLVTATNYSRLCSEGKALLEANGCRVIENDFGRPMTFQELSDRVGDADAVVAGVDTWNDDVFAIAPRLKVISRFGVGVDNIDVEAARARNIKVTNAAGGNANAVAELTIGLIISAMRGIPELHASTRKGAWDRFVGEELIGRTVGILGFGNIAQKIAKKLKGFEVKVLAYDKFPNAEAANALGVELVDADTVLTQSDIVCTMLPSLPETRQFMNADRFAMMKDGAYFINTARGALVDETALKSALDTGKLRGAAIDVYEREPTDATNPLFQAAGLVTTPHTAAETYETYSSIGVLTAQAVIDALEGREPRNLL
ncbi:D-3-phosphoglycerate dehydrogenase [Devosia crocina]|uniref:D-3-phosphoglycerate dehydrogenase n=1 Tax=Devosia crocina TaxID=429728 RepID=A0A1I7N7Z9_9HYPH|nr:phosphoglycerate dehydrogenase [Devosia crocina]SFV30703.1 D-3-phosphoglycerate dehydrogenase [Devosia crocina]